MPKRKRGRPKIAVKKIFKSVSIPAELWVECFNLAQKHGSYVGRVVWNRIKNGRYDPAQDTHDKEVEMKQARQSQEDPEEEGVEFE